LDWIEEWCERSDPKREKAGAMTPFHPSAAAVEITVTLAVPTTNINVTITVINDKNVDCIKATPLEDRPLL
jgi:hypothetical protein